MRTFSLKLPNTPLCLGLLFALCASQSQATNVQDAYALARISDPILQQAFLNLKYSKENIVQAKSELLPTIGGQVSVGWQDNNDTSHTNTKGYVINLSQAIYSPALNSAYKKVQIIESLAALEYKKSEQDLIIRTLNAYIESMIAKNSLSSARASERAIKKRLDSINTQFEVGVIAITDVHEAKASYDNAKVDLIISEGALQNSLEVLQRLTNTPIQTIDTLSHEYVAMSAKSLSPAQLIEQAVANNLGILLNKKSIESAQQDTNISNASLKPSLNLQASHSRTDNSATGGYTNNQLSVVLSMPLYNAGRLRSKVRQTMTAQEIQKSILLDNTRAVTQQVRSIIRDINTNVLAIKARKQSILSSQAALSAISEGVDVGTRNIVDLLQAEQSLFSAKEEHATARLNHVRLEFELKHQLGSVSEDDLNELAIWMITEK